MKWHVQQERLLQLVGHGLFDDAGVRLCVIQQLRTSFSTNYLIGLIFARRTELYDSSLPLQDQTQEGPAAMPFRYTSRQARMVERAQDGRRIRSTQAVPADLFTELMQFCVQLPSASAR